MQISVSIQLEKNETLAYTPDAAAMQVIVALGGSAADDFCQVWVMSASEPGSAGAPPPAPLEASAETTRPKRARRRKVELQK